MMILNLNLPDPRKILVAVITLLILVLILSGCSVKTAVGWKKETRQNILLNKVVAMNKDVLNPVEIRFDTVIVTDVVQATDTFIVTEHDTIMNTINDIKYRIIRRVDTFQIDIECPPDTVKLEVVKYVDQVKIVPLTWWQKNRWWVFIVLLSAIFLYILQKIKR